MESHAGRGQQEAAAEAMEIQVQQLRRQTEELLAKLQEAENSRKEAEDRARKAAQQQEEHDRKRREAETKLRNETRANGDTRCKQRRWATMKGHGRTSTRLPREDNNTLRLFER